MPGVSNIAQQEEELEALNRVIEELRAKERLDRPLMVEAPVTPYRPIILPEETVSVVNEDGGAALHRTFFYLAGPMSGYPGFNFSTFNLVAKNLRDHGLNICNPAELGHEQEAKAALASPDGKQGHGTTLLTWAECLRRDIELVAHPNCAGVICLDGWEKSEGAQFETYVAYKLRKPIFRYVEDGTLEILNRRESLKAAGIED